MKIEQILIDVLDYWPNKVDVSDGELIHKTNGYISKNLSIAWNYAEKRAQGNDWHELGVWVIYGLLHSIAKSNFGENIQTLSLSKITIDMFKTNYLKQLQHESYQDMLSQYIIENPTHP